MIDLNRSEGIDEDVLETIADQFTYHQWDEAKIKRGTYVRIALEKAVQTIINYVPPCPDRTVALRKIREARMDCNSAITHDGKY